MISWFQFMPFYSSDFTEKLLEDHETELDAIKKHYNDNAHLFAMVTLSDKFLIN